MLGSTNLQGDDAAQAQYPAAMKTMAHAAAAEKLRMA